MTFQLQWLTRRIVAAVAVALFVAPPALATDLRSPDTRDAASAVHGVAPVDLRSPDTRDAAGLVRTGQPTSVAVDLRSPDTRDAADGRLPSSDALPVQVTVVRPGSFNWSDAGIGAGAGAGLVLLVLGTSLLVRLGRTEARPA